MNPHQESEWIWKVEYHNLSLQVESHNDIQSALKEAYELTKWVKKERDKSKNNPSRYKELDNMLNSFIKEYRELEKAIIDAINNDKKITEKEKTKIMFELSDIVSLAEKLWIKERKNIWSKVWDKWKGTDTEKARSEAAALNEKKELITKYFKKEKFSETELKKLLTISNENRKNKWEFKNWNSAWYAARFFGLDSTSADVFLSQEEVIRTNQFQDDIIKRIWLEKWYNESWDIHAFHPSMWNYITNVPIVESALKTNNVQNLWNKALKNYIWFLENKWELTSETLIKKFWKDKATEVLAFIDRQKTKDSDLIWASFLNKIWDLIEWVKNYFKEKILPLFNKIKSSSNINEFKNNLNSVKELKWEEKKALLEEFDKEIKNKESALKKLFFEPVKAKLIKDWKSEIEANKEALEITDKTLNEIESNLSVSNLDKVFKIIEDFNKKYDAKLSTKRATSLAVETTVLKWQRDAVKSTGLAEEARKKWDTEGAKKHEQNARSSMIRAAEAETVWKIVSKTSEQEARDIWTWKLDYKEHLEKILNTDENLRNEIKKLDAEKKKFEEEVIWTDDIINKTENASNQVIDAWDAQYNPENWNVQIWEKTLNLSTEEQKLVENNPDTLKNIVDFYSTLNKVWLAKLWPIKEQIFNVISSIKWVWFKIDQNYLSENETKIFLNAILKSTWEETINPILGINDFVANIERKNNTQFSWAEAQVNKSWDTKIEQKFISSFAPRWNLLWFDSPAFEQKIRS